MILVKPGALQLKKAWQAVLNAIDVGPLSDQSLVDPHDVLFNLDLKFALLFVLSPGLVQCIQKPLVELAPDPDDNLLIGFVPGNFSELCGEYKILDFKQISEIIEEISWVTGLGFLYRDTCEGNGFSTLSSPLPRCHAISRFFLYIPKID